MNLQKLILSLLTGVFALSAAASEIQWTTESLVGLHIELVDPEQYESMRFIEDGAVLMGVGRKKGALAAPVFYWSLVSGRLRIVMDDKKLYEEFTLVSRDSEKIVARRRTGELVTYKIQK